MPGSAPCSIGQPASVKVRIDGYVVTKALGCGEQRVQLNLLYGPFASLATLGLLDYLEDLRVSKRCELLRDLWKPLEHRERFD